MSADRISNVDLHHLMLSALDSLDFDSLDRLPRFGYQTLAYNLHYRCFDPDRWRFSNHSFSTVNFIRTSLYSISQRLKLIFSTSFFSPTSPPTSGADSRGGFTQLAVTWQALGPYQTIIRYYAADDAFAFLHNYIASCPVSQIGLCLPLRTLLTLSSPARTHPYRSR